MATYSNILTWRIPWTEGHGQIQSVGSQRVGHNLVTNTFNITRDLKEMKCQKGQRVYFFPTINENLLFARHRSKITCISLILKPPYEVNNNTTPFRLDEAQVGIKISGRNISNLRYIDDTTLMAESKEELKILLMKMKEESEKAGLKFNIQKTKIMASSPITSWQIDGDMMETVTDYFLGLQNHHRW